MYIKQVNGNIFDVFFGDGWESHSRVSVSENEGVKILSGLPIHDLTKKAIYSIVRSRTLPNRESK